MRFLSITTHNVLNRSSLYFVLDDSSLAIQTTPNKIKHSFSIDCPKVDAGNTLETWIPGENIIEQLKTQSCIGLGVAVGSCNLAIICTCRKLKPAKTRKNIPDDWLRFRQGCMWVCLNTEGIYICLQTSFNYLIACIAMYSYIFFNYSYYSMAMVGWHELNPPCSSRLRQLTPSKSFGANVRFDVPQAWCRRQFLARHVAMKTSPVVYKV